MCTHLAGRAPRDRLPARQARHRRRRRTKRLALERRLISTSNVGRKMSRTEPWGHLRIARVGAYTFSKDDVQGEFAC